MGAWDPAQYDRFKEERRQPFRDLLALVERRSRMRVVDLGCGTGETTAELHRALGAKETLGIDSSETMLAKATPEPGLRFERARIEDFVGNDFDLVFSNAALHWVEAHDVLLPRLARMLAQDGQLAVQMPANDDHLSHRTAAEVAATFGLPPRADHMLAVERYVEILHRAGLGNVHARLQVYSHLLPSRDEVVEWVKGTLLTDSLARLPADAHVRFLDDYRAQLLPRLSAERPFLYTYKRVLFRAKRS